MPHLSQAQIDEIEIEIADLAEENRDLREENAALKAEIYRRDQLDKVD